MSRALPLLMLALLWSQAAIAQKQPLRRFALLIATNDGGEDRVRLRYAVSDARNFAEVLRDLGGVDARDTELIEDADRASVVGALAGLRQRVDRARQSGQRTEAIIYFSGHSDEEGLLLGRERFGFPELRTAIETLPADVRVAILDSCASGALARRKGGARRPAFMLDASTDVRGQAILTSSSADEASQESDRIGASFFTHHLVSGLRGAADVSRDGQVTLNEAYQFAFRETLARTESTQAGAQHPVYDIDMAGSGDLVLTDLRTQGAGLAFARDVEGRLFVRDAQERLVLEIRKAPGESVEVGLAEGSYSVFRQNGDSFARTNVTVPAGSRVMVTGGHFTSVAAQPTVMRGSGQQHWFANVGLVPFVQTNDLSDVPVRNNFSFGFVAARAAQVDGAAIGLAAHWIDGNATGLQLGGAFNGIGGNARGVQVSGGGNFVGGSITGWQLGAAFNHAGEVRGVQVAGALNHASALRGAQLGVLNIGGEVTGAQVGVVNIGSKVKGLQLGVINVGGDVDGASVGILNFVRNGYLHVEAYGSDFAMANVAVKLGSRHVYTVLGAGRLYPGGTGEDAWLATAGIGGHIPFGRWFVDADLVTSSLMGDSWNSGGRMLHQLRAIGGFEVAHSFAIMAGPTFNVAHQVGQVAPPTPSLAPSSRVGRAALWPGLQLGVRY